MTQLYIMAFVTTVIALLLFGVLYRQFAIPGQWKKNLADLCVGLADESCCLLPRSFAYHQLS